MRKEKLQTEIDSLNESINKLNKDGMTEEEYDSMIDLTNEKGLLEIELENINKVLSLHGTIGTGHELIKKLKEVQILTGSLGGEMKDEDRLKKWLPFTPTVNLQDVKYNIGFKLISLHPFNKSGCTESHIGQILGLNTATYGLYNVIIDKNAGTIHISDDTFELFIMEKEEKHG